MANKPVFEVFKAPATADTTGYEVRAEWNRTKYVIADVWAWPGAVLGNAEQNAQLIADLLNKHFEEKYGEQETHQAQDL